MKVRIIASVILLPLLILLLLVAPKICTAIVAAVVAAIAVYEILRQGNFEDLKIAGELTQFSWEE